MLFQLHPGFTNNQWRAEVGGSRGSGLGHPPFIYISKVGIHAKNSIESQLWGDPNQGLGSHHSSKFKEQSSARTFLTIVIYINLFGLRYGSTWDPPCVVHNMQPVYGCSAIEPGRCREPELSTGHLAPRTTVWSRKIISSGKRPDVSTQSEIPNQWTSRKTWSFMVGTTCYSTLGDGLAILLFWFFQLASFHSVSVVQTFTISFRALHSWFKFVSPCWLL